MKIKPRTKKILVLSIMVALLVTTGVLNFVLNDKLTQAKDQPTGNESPSVTQTFFAAARSDREATRESEFLYLDAIIQSESSSTSAKTTAEEQKMLLVERMEKELELETGIKARGFEDAIVTIGDGGIIVVVGTEELSKTDANKILSIVVAATGCKTTDVKILPYV